MATFKKALQEGTASKPDDGRDDQPDDHLCTAPGCPNAWASTFRGRLCMPHVQAPVADWPRVTREQQRAAQGRQKPTKLEPGDNVPRPRPEAVARVLSKLSRNEDPRAVMLARAEAMKEREERGEHLSPPQRAWWRAVLEGRRAHLTTTETDVQEGSNHAA